MTDHSALIERLEDAHTLDTPRSVTTGPTQVADASGWIPWHGGPNPCPGRRVDAVWMDVVRYSRLSDKLEWGRTECCHHITSYRPLPSAPNQAKALK